MLGDGSGDPRGWRGLGLNIERIFTIGDHLVFDARIMLAIVFTSAALTTANMPFIVGLLVKQKFVWVDILNVCAMFVFIGFLFALLYGIETRAMWVTVATLPQLLVSQGVQVLMSRRVMPSLKVRLRDFRLDLVLPLLSFGSWTVAARVAQVLRIACGPLILKQFPSSATQGFRDLQVGTFKLGGVAETKLLPLSTVPLLRVLPALTAMYATGQIDRLQRTFYRLTRYLLWTYLLMAAPLIVYHRELFALYTGDRLPDASLVMALLIAKAAVIFPQPLLDQLTSAQGQKRAIALRIIVTESLVFGGMVYAVVFAAADAVTVAAVSLGITCAVYPPLFWSFAIQLTQSSWGQWCRDVLVRGSVPALVATPVWLGLAQLLPADSWLTLATDVVIGCTVYVLAILTLCLRPSERDDLRNLLMRLPGLGRG